MGVVSLLLIPASASALPTTHTTTHTIDHSQQIEIDSSDLNQSDCPEPETIDQDTAICQATVSDDSAQLLIYSDRHQTITISDAGAFFEGGTVNQQTQTMQPGLNRVEMRVTTYEGFSGVSVSTDSTLYALPLEDLSTLIGGPWTAQDSQLAGLGAALGVSLVSVLIVLQTIIGRSDEPERIA